MRFDREANFFKLPRRVLLAEKLRFVVEGTTEIVTHTLELPSSQRKSILSSMLANQPELLKNAEYLLRKAYRFPDDIPAEQVVSNAERQQLEQGWQNIDDFLKLITDGVEIQSPRGSTRPSFVCLSSTGEDIASNVCVVLNEYNRLDGWNRAFCLHTFLDEEELRKPNSGVYHGAGYDSVYLYRTSYPDGQVASYHLHFQGKFKPLTPWHCLHRGDYPLIRGIIDKANSSTYQYHKGQMEVYSY